MNLTGPNSDKAISDYFSLATICAYQLRNEKFKGLALQKIADALALPKEKMALETAHFGLWWSGNRLDNYSENDFNLIELKNNLFENKILVLTYSKFISNIKFNSLVKLQIEESSFDPSLKIQFDLPSIESIWINKCSLKKIHKSIIKLNTLTELNLTGNQIIHIPDRIDCLFNLTKLCIGHNQIDSLPDSFSNLTALTFLSVFNNILQQFPPPIVQLTKIHTLALSFNRISNIDSNISNLSNLTILDLEDNNIKEVPKSISELTKMKNLCLTSNGIQNIDHLTHLSALDYLGIGSNPIPLNFFILNHITEENRLVGGIENEILNFPSKKKIPLPTVSFNLIIKELRLLVKDIESDKLNEKTVAILEKCLELIKNLSLYYKGSRIISLTYEEIQDLKGNGFETVARYIFLKEGVTQNISAILDLFLIFNIVDKSIFENIEISVIYNFINYIFVSCADLNLHKHLIISALTFLGDLEGHYALMHPTHLQVSDNHPLINLKFRIKEDIILVLLAKIIDKTNLMSNPKFKKIKRMLLEYKKNLDVTSPASQYCRKKLDNKMGIKYSPPSEYSPALNLILGLEINEYKRNLESYINENIELDPWAYEDCLETFMSEYAKNPHLYKSNPIFDFLYRQCFFNASFISKHPQASSFVKFLCCSLENPSNRKKALEALAVLFIANPKLKLFEKFDEWIPDHFFDNEIKAYVQKAPRLGEKLAWCGALMLLEVPLYGREFMNLVILPSIKDRSQISIDTFKLFWNAIFHKEDSLINPIFNRLSDQFHQHYIECQQMQQLIGIELIKIYEKVFEGALGILRKNRKEFINSITKIEEARISELNAKIEKINFIFKQMGINEKNQFLNETHKKISEWFSAIFILKKELKDRIDDHIDFYSHLIKRLNRLKDAKNLNCGKIEEEIKEKDNYSLIDLNIKCNDILKLFEVEIINIENKLTDVIYKDATKFYNLNAEIKFQNWDENPKREKLKKIVKVISVEFSEVIPQMQFDIIKDIGEGLNPTNLERYNIKKYTDDMDDKLDQLIRTLCAENIQQEKNKKIISLENRVKELEQQLLDAQKKELKNEKKIQSNSTIDEIFLQTSQLIENEIEFLQSCDFNLFEGWGEEWDDGWKTLHKSLKEILSMTGTSDKRNCDRQEAVNLLTFAGFRAPDRRLNGGSHVGGLIHPLFRYTTTVSFNQSKQVSFDLMTIYFQLVHKTLKKWHKKIMQMNEFAENND